MGSVPDVSRTFGQSFFLSSCLSALSTPPLSHYLSFLPWKRMSLKSCSRLSLGSMLELKYLRPHPRIRICILMGSLRDSYTHSSLKSTGIMPAWTMRPPSTNCLLISGDVVPQTAFQVDDCFQKGQERQGAHQTPGVCKLKAVLRCMARDTASASGDRGS